MKRKPSGYWKIKDNCISEAGKYDSRAKFHSNANSAYNSAKENSWLDEACQHMIDRVRNPLKRKKYVKMGFWNDKQNCINEAKKYSTLTEFKTKSCSAYNSCNKNGWVEAFDHMIKLREKKGYWTKERCKEVAKKYSSRSEFQKNSTVAYMLSLKRNWGNEVCEHMEFIVKPNGYWNDKENCRKEASKYKSRNEFRIKSITAYNSSHKNGFMDEFFETNRKVNGHWNDRLNCINTANGCRNITEFMKLYLGAYVSSKRNGWICEVREIFKEKKRVVN